QRKIRHFLDSFKSDPEKNTFLYTFRTAENEELIYSAKVNYLYDNDRRRGYIVTFTDDTANQKYIRLLDSYNEDLRQEVEVKTRHIVEMHDNLIMSLAMMVESRDNSTGGHIKRTSQGVRILVEEMVRSNAFALSEEFCRDVVKAAPMHDLGKINVDDAVLRKPGRFTDEEYEKMKHHAEEGARVIHEILRQTDDESFKIVAENVAHYHHERWDGSGYPAALSGEQIPLEARIMAVADVYDALVSKRVYKEAFDFQKADRIIMEGMGSQFDPALREVYVAARPRLEEYYLSLEQS
ncbi:MAG TPA: HD domain-containing protein, partial [Ruminococcus sp.]|nr:HD domain-containing protein [Ruminococcus sp.]